MINMRDQIVIWRMLAVLIYDTQKTTKAISQLKDTHGKNGSEKTTKMYFVVILKAIQHKEGSEKEW